MKPNAHVLTSAEQLDLWVKGDSRHREGGECCPDFSCCRPELLAPFEVREHFAELVRSGQETGPLLMTFLGRMLESLPVQSAYYLTDGETRKVV